MLDQTEQNIEIIIIDDYSDDVAALKHLIQRLDHNNIRLIEHNQNLHGGAARNTGILAAQGKYVALLDSDDTWEPTKLATCIKHCKDLKDVVHSQVHSFGAIHPKRGKLADEAVSEYLICNGGALQTSTLLLHTTFAQSVLFDPNLVRFQDYDFALRLEKEGAKFIFINEVLTRMLDDAVSRISGGVDYKPALYWLEKADSMTQTARNRFYVDRVVKLLLASGNRRGIFTHMPNDIKASITQFTKLKLGLIAFSPDFLLNTLFWIIGFLKDNLPHSMKSSLKLWLTKA